MVDGMIRALHPSYNGRVSRRRVANGFGERRIFLRSFVFGLYPATKLRTLGGVLRSGVFST
jgi:hypothetical protein